MLKLPNPNVAAEIRTVYLLYRPAVLPGNSLFKNQAHASQLAVKETKLYENLTYELNGYRVKLQCWEYAE